MSLVRLLEIGRSLNAIKDTQSRYRMKRHNLLPKFSMASSANVFHPLTANMPSKSTELSHRLRRSVTLGAGNGVASELQWKKILQAFLSPLERMAEFFPKALRSLSSWAGKKVGAFKFIAGKREPLASRISNPVKAEFQPELSLDNVTVVRNDLSEADLQVVPVRKTEKSFVVTQPAEVTPQREPVSAVWERLKSRLFRVPISYRDETGFHREVVLARKKIGWTPFW